jgi:hypothetical protein
MIVSSKSGLSVGLSAFASSAFQGGDEETGTTFLNALKYPIVGSTFFPFCAFFGARTASGRSVETGRFVDIR